MASFPTKKLLYYDDIEQIKPNLDAVKILSFESAEKMETLAFERDGKKVALLTTNNHTTIVQQLTQSLEAKGFKPDLFFTDNTSFTYALGWYKQLISLEEKTRLELEEREQASGFAAEDMIKTLFDKKQTLSENDFIVEIIRLSFKSGASDVHFQSEEIGYVMRVRKDGVLKKLIVFDHKDFRRYFIKLKFMSGVRLNIDDVPQDGRFDFDVTTPTGKNKIDVRVSFMPGLRGESVVMRFLDGTKGIMSLTNIGFQDYALGLVEQNIRRNYGMILITGPTGSGKTTTLYSILDKLNDNSKKIITLEDPVEYEIPNIQQSQINESKGYSYSMGLKAILRQDPDIIMVGEIRDLDTAQIAINAALTGHLVLSTLHTNTAMEAVSRLLNMGVQPYLLAPAVNLIIGQRLVRKLDTNYSQKEASAAEKQDIQARLENIRLLQKKQTLDNYQGTMQKLSFDGKIPIPVGNDDGLQDGYNGRVAVIETLAIDDMIESALIHGKSTIEVYRMARDAGFMTMAEDGYSKLLQNLTTLDEIRRVL